MKLLHVYEDGNFIWVYPESEFTLDRLKQHKQDFENHPRPNQCVSLVDNYHEVVARTAVVLNDRNGKLEIRYRDGTVLIRDDNGNGGFIPVDLKQLLIEAIDAIVRGAQRRRRA